VASKQARVTKRNVVNIIHRLIDKGFLEVVSPAVVHGRRAPATYRVLSYTAVRENQRRKGQDWVIHVGNGIDYACKLEAQM
jgi:hypothetical protein